MHLSSRFSLIASLVIVAFLGSAPGLIAAQTPSPVAATPTAAQTAPVGEPAGSNWTTYGGNLYNPRYSGLDRITTSNVAQLKGAWTYHTGVQSTGTSFESSPVVVGHTMYLTGPQSQVWALDATTGKELWKYVPQIQGVEALPLCCGQDNRGVA